MKIGSPVKKNIIKKNFETKLIMFYFITDVNFSLITSIYLFLKKSWKTFLLFCYVGYKGNSLSYSFPLHCTENHKNLEFGRKKPKTNSNQCQYWSITSTSTTEVVTTPVWPTEQTKIEHKLQISYYYYLQMLEEHIH